ncbi:MAG: hypothetical protein V2A74_00525 [bacterium]
MKLLSALSLFISCCLFATAQTAPTPAHGDANDRPTTGPCVLFFNHADGGLYWITLDGKGPFPLQGNNIIQRAPALSPDGKSLAFAFHPQHLTDPFDPHDAAVEIGVQEIGSNRFRRLTDNDTRDYSPAWSSDGRWVIFAHDSPSVEVGQFHANDRDLVGAAADGTTATINVTHWVKSDPFEINDSPSWSRQPKTNLIVFTKISPTHMSASLWLMRPNGTRQRNIDLTIYGLIEVRDPIFGTDDRSLIFAGRKAGTGPLEQFGLEPFDIYRCTLDGRNLQRLTDRGGAQCSKPCLSPDGTTLVFVEAREKSLRLMQMVGVETTPHYLTPNNFLATDPCFSPRPLP